MAEEQVLLDQYGVLVTNTRFTNGNETFALSNITSVKTGVTPAKRGSMIIVGLLLILFGIVIHPVALILAIIAAFYLIAIVPKDEYNVVLSTSGGEVKALSSPDMATVKAICNAITQAIVVRG